MNAVTVRRCALLVIRASYPSRPVVVAHATPRDPWDRAPMEPSALQIPSAGQHSERIVAPVSAVDDVLRVEHIAKRFGPVTALRDVNLHLRQGEVLGLLGDNGAGKSTLIKIICGLYRADSGSIWLKGQPYTPKTVDDAHAHGVEAVYQDLALIDELPVYANLFLKHEELHRPIPF